MPKLSSPHTTSAPLSVETKTSILAAILITTFAALGFGYSSPLIAQNLERMTQSGFIIGVLISVAAVATIVITPITPRLLHHLRARPLLFVMIIIACLCMPLHKVFMFTEAWYILRFLTGCAFTIIFVVCEIWINQLTPTEKRGRVLAIYSVGLAGGFGLGTALCVYTGIDGVFPFFFASALFAGGIIPLVLLQKGKKVQAPSKSESSFSHIIKLMRLAPALMVCGALFGAIEQGIGSLLPVYGTRLGLSEHHGRLLLIAAVLGNLILQYPIGYLADTVSKKKLLLSIMLTMLFLPLLIAAAGVQFYIICFLVFLYSGLSGGLYTAGLVLLTMQFRAEDTASANSAFILAYGLGSFFIPISAGYLMDRIIPYGFMYGMAIAAACGLICLLMRPPQA